MRQGKTVIGFTFLSALLLAMFVLVLPVPATWQQPTSLFYIQLAGYAMIACLHVGAAVLFTMNLDVYKAALRRAYITIAAGIVLTAIGTLQVPIIGALDAWQSAWVRGGGLVLPFFLSTLLLYLAVQYIARIVKMKHLLTQVWLVLLVAISLSSLSSFLPHVHLSVDELTFDILLGTISWSAFLLLCASLLVMGLKRHAGSHYTQAMSWLSRALLNSFLIFAVQLIYTLIGTDSTGLLAQLSTVLALASGFLWLRAGYAFSQTKEYDESTPLLSSLFGKPQSTIPNKPKTVVDMVTYAASLASNTDEIDPLLDKLRTVTSKLKPGEEPSASDTASLIDIYLKIEQFLTTKEAIRTYNQKDLRGFLPTNLQDMIMSHKTRGANV